MKALSGTSSKLTENKKKYRSTSHQGKSGTSSIDTRLSIPHHFDHKTIGQTKRRRKFTPHS
jgi:hypothetical protein